MASTTHPFLTLTTVNFDASLVVLTASSHTLKHMPTHARTQGSAREQVGAPGFGDAPPA